MTFGVGGIFQMYIVLIIRAVSGMRIDFLVRVQDPC